MTVKIGSYNFDGPFRSTDSIKDKSGIYAVLHYKDGKCYLLDVDESSKMKTEIEEHNKKEWEKKSEGQIDFSVYYTPKLEADDRKEIKAEIRSAYLPPCGKS